MRTALSALFLTTIVGCGASAPDVSAVKENMAPEQLTLGEPLVNSIGMILVPVPAGEFQMGTAVSDASPEERLEKLLEPLTSWTGSQ